MTFTTDLESSNESTSSTTLFFFNLSIVILILVINFVLRKIIELLADLEKRTFYTELLYSKIHKVFLFIFFNTGIIIIFTVTSISNLREIQALFGQNGIVYNIQSIMMFNLITPFLWSLFHPAHLFKTLKYRLLRKKLKNSPEKSTYIQTEANQIYEKNNFDIHFKYFSILKSLCICFFYLLIIPYGVLFVLFEMFLFYITDRFSISRRCLKLRQFDFILTLEVLSYFDICLIFLPLGYIVLYKRFIKIRVGFILIACFVLTIIEALVINIRILFTCCQTCRAFEGSPLLYRDISYEIKSFNDSNPATMEFYIFDDKSKNMLSVMYSPNHTKFTFKNVSSLADSGDPNEFDWEKLQTENSLIGESAQKKQPRSENGRLIPKFSFHKNSETEAEEKNKEVNILSIVKMMGNRGPLTKGSKFHFEDKADTIQFLHGKDNVFQKVIKEEDEGSQKSTIRSVDNSGLVENIKLNNQISFIMDHKKILNSMESRYRDMEQKGHARKLWFNDPNTESESSHTDSINLKNNFSSSLNVSQFTFWFGNAN